MLELLINYGGLLFTAFTTCTYTSEITAIIKPLLSPIYYTTVTVFKGIKGIYTYLTSWEKDGGSVDPSTPTPQTEVKEGNTDNSQEGVNNTPNTSLSPRVKLVDIPSNTGTNTIWSLFNLDYKPTPNTALYSIPLHTTDFYNKVAVGNAEWWLENKPTFEQRVARGELTVTESLLDRYNSAKVAVETANRQEANRLGLLTSNQSR